MHHLVQEVTPVNPPVAPEKPIIVEPVQPMNPSAIPIASEQPIIMEASNQNMTQIPVVDPNSTNIPFAIPVAMPAQPTSGYAAPVPITPDDLINSIVNTCILSKPDFICRY